MRAFLTRLLYFARRRRYLAIWSAGLLTIALVIAAAYSPISPLNRLNYLIFDTYQKLKPREMTESAVAVVDIDVHHGNGTQWAFYTDPAVLVVNTHQFPFYPGTGAVTEIGQAAGLGATLNAPLEAGATDADHALLWNSVIDPVLARFAPELIVVSAGFDGHQDDPLGSQRMTTAGFRAWLAAIRARAQQSCEGRLAVVTEGGYDLQALRACLDATVDVLHGDVAADTTWRDAGGPDRRGRATADALQAHPLVRG